MPSSQRKDSPDDYEITSAWSALTEWKSIIMPFETNICKTLSVEKEIISFLVAANFPDNFDVLITTLCPEISLSDTTALLLAA